MDNYRIIKLRENSELLDKAAQWFHEKWGFPMEVYRESMAECLEGGTIPQWYIAVEGELFIGGMGVIANDFHPRKDLTPNVCAVYVDEAFRGRGIAGKLLNYVSEDMHSLGIDTLYLLADIIGFYERYGWEFHCMVTGDGEDEPSRCYMHQYK